MTVDCMALLYCATYLILLVPIVWTFFERGEPVDFSNFESIHNLFQFRDVMLAGWTHYIAFDLLVACGVVLDAKSVGLPHKYVCLCLPIILMAGPVGVLVYVLMRETFLVLRSAKIQITTLSLMYVLVVLLCVMMVFWIFLFPATAFMTENKLWIWGDYFGKEIGEMSVSSAVPLTLTTKYVGHAAVQYLHQIPCGLWVIILPFQLLPCMRKNYPTIHKILGYIFTISSMVLMIGVSLIHVYKLGYVQNDYPELIPKLLSEDGVAIANQYGLFGNIARALIPYDRAIMLIISVWFSSTIFLAIRAARARKFQEHRGWIYRHAASGLWVAVMRIFVVIGVFANKSQEMGKFTNFTCGVIFSCVLTAMFAEVVVYKESQQKFEQSFSDKQRSENWGESELTGCCTCS